MIQIWPSDLKDIRNVRTGKIQEAVLKFPPTECSQQVYTDESKHLRNLFRDLQETFWYSVVRQFEKFSICSVFGLQRGNCMCMHRTWQLLATYCMFSAKDSKKGNT